MFSFSMPSRPFRAVSDGNVAIVGIFTTGHAVGNTVITYIREHSVTSKPLARNGYRAKIGVQSARFFIRNVSNPLHLAS